MPSLQDIEHLLQEPFDKKKVKFKSKTVLEVTILEYRGLKSKVFCDKVCGTFKPYFRISCPKLLTGKSTFTLAIKTNKSSDVVNETFKFVLPESYSECSFPLWIQMYLEDKRTIAGSTAINASELILDETIFKTYHLIRGSGEFDVRICKARRYQPDFRLGFGLNRNEKEFRVKRLPKVFDVLNSLLDEKDKPRTVGKTPVISVIGSGGGYRAMVGMFGAMEALTDAGIMDALTYVSGVSGSAWYLSTAYACDGMRKQTHKQFHDQLRQATGEDLEQKLFSLNLNIRFSNNYRQIKELYNEPITFVDLYGYVLGHTLLRDKIETKLSDLQDVVKTGEVPYPFFMSLHVKDTVPSGEFHALVENSPFEIGVPQFGIGLLPRSLGSLWNHGFEIRKTPEVPLYYLQGVCGSAFCVLLRRYLIYGSESYDQLLHDLDELRKLNNLSKKLQKSSKKSLTESSTSTNFIKKALVKNEFFGDRNALIKRTGEIFNFTLNFTSIESFKLNPLSHTKEAQEFFLLKNEEGNCLQQGFRKKTTMNTKAEIISLVDAGIFNNVCAESVMRPQRTPDLILVMDFSTYESDSCFSYDTLFLAAEEANKQGIRFPPLNFETVVQRRPEVLQVFEDEDDDDCPTVLWFTLCNRDFQKLQNYKPRSKEKLKQGEIFNKFPVYNKGNAYESTDLHYNKLEFDRLHELMYYNLTSNIETIKRHVGKAVHKKERRINKLLREVWI